MKRVSLCHSLFLVYDLIENFMRLLESLLGQDGGSDDGRSWLKSGGFVIMLCKHLGNSSM